MEKEKCYNSVLRDVIFMAYVLSVEGVTGHFEKEDLSVLYSLLFGLNIEEDYNNYKNFKDNGN